jgi:hypothetical protein
VTSFLAATRRAWHGVAELVLAGPQYRASGTIRLRVAPGGFATTDEPALAVSHDLLVTKAGQVGLDGATCADLASAIGAPVGPPEGLYHGGSGVAAGEVLRFDPDALAVLGDAFTTGDHALRTFAPAITPVLWPEHFDVSVTVEEVTYGVSPGDDYLDEPYVYVGPLTPRTGPFWNAPFGAAVPLATLTTVAAVVDFFTTGRDS